jgi:hypothetical protein
VSFAAITLCIASQRVFIVAVVYFVIESVRKLLDTPCYDRAVPVLLGIRYYYGAVNDIRKEPAWLSQYSD